MIVGTDDQQLCLQVQDQAQHFARGVAYLKVTDDSVSTLSSHRSDMSFQVFLGVCERVGVDGRCGGVSSIKAAGAEDMKHVQRTSWEGACEARRHGRDAHCAVGGIESA